MWDSEKLYLMSPPCPPFLYPLSWLFPVLLSLSFSFLGIEEGTCRFKVADSCTGLGDILALPIFSLFIFVSVFFSFPLRQPSSRKLVFWYIFYSLCSLLFSLFLWPFRASKKGQETNVRQWETVPDIPALPTFSLSTFLAFPHPSVPLLLFSGHRRRDMQIRSGR